MVLVNFPPLAECPSEVQTEVRRNWFPAVQIFVQPWLGPHHVYGVFSVPRQYRRDRLYTVRLLIQGIAEEFPETSPEGGELNSGQAESGHYMKRVYIPTRIALWLLLTGRFGDLKMPCHWWLVITDRMR